MHELNCTAADVFARKKISFNKTENIKQKKLERKEEKKLVESDELKLSERKKLTILNTRLNELGFWSSTQKSKTSSAREASSKYMVLSFKRRLALELDSNNVRKMEKASSLESVGTIEWWNARIENWAASRGEELQLLNERLDQLRGQIEELSARRERRQVTNGAFADQAQKLKAKRLKVERESREVLKKIHRDDSSIKSLRREIAQDRAFFGSKEYKSFLTEHTTMELSCGFQVMEKVLAEAEHKTDGSLQFVTSLKGQLKALKDNLNPLETEAQKIRSKCRKPDEPKYPEAESLEDYFKVQDKVNKLTKAYEIALDLYEKEKEAFLRRTQLDDLSPNVARSLSASAGQALIRNAELQSAGANSTRQRRSKSLFRKARRSTGLIDRSVQETGPLRHYIGGSENVHATRKRPFWKRMLTAFSAQKN
ncbi:hypothetical protein [Labrenzia sp. THAF82]|uniref:hypothetical protein n=1 Tax=Labrenzia sp. THAF82 TaxID=2587861 RepID=UPI001267AB6F|nr:hypothetical protein [Labrenzia sp. THAF82]